MTTPCLLRGAHLSCSFAPRTATPEAQHDLSRTAHRNCLTALRRLGSACKRRAATVLPPAMPLNLTLTADECSNTPEKKTHAPTTYTPPKGLGKKNTLRASPITFREVVVTSAIKGPAALCNALCNDAPM